MKKLNRKYIVSFIIAAFFVAMSVISVSAAREVQYIDGERVYDFADLFSSYEEDELREYALSIEEDAKCEFYVLTTDDAEGKTAMAYADDFGDNGAFGYEAEYGTYIVMLIDMDNREVWLSTSGDAIDHFDDYRIEKALDIIFEYVPDGEYYEAAEAYLEVAHKYMLEMPSYNDKNYYDDDYYYDDNYYHVDEDDYYVVYEDDTMELAEIILPCFLGSAVISGIVLAIMASGAKTKMTAGSRTYINGGVRINQRDDIFTHTTTVKRRIESSSSGGGSRSGGGGRHTSSGGRSHGGGGRKF